MQIGRKSDRLEGFAFLGRGVTRASFQIVGNSQLVIKEIKVIPNNS